VEVLQLRVSSQALCSLQFRAHIRICLVFSLQLDYDGQRKRTKVKTKDLDPTWNEKVKELLELLSFAIAGFVLSLLSSVCCCLKAKICRGLWTGVELLLIFIKYLCMCSSNFRCPILLRVEIWRLMFTTSAIVVPVDAAAFWGGWLSPFLACLRSPKLQDGTHCRSEACSRTSRET
jgi:hypothetical protein